MIAANPSEPLPALPARVLVIEDDDAHTELIQSAFEQEPDTFSVTFTSSIQEAQEIVRNHPPDLIIADWLLPDGKGIDILQRTDGHVAIPLIIMTSHGNETLAVDLIRSGVIDYIVKSRFSFQELPRTAVRVLREWSHIQKQLKADQALLQNRETLASIMDSITESVFLTTLEGTVLEANETTARRLGTGSARDLIGENVWTYIPPDLAEYRKGRVTEVIKTGLPLLFEDVRNGRTYSNTLFPVKDVSGMVTRIAVFCMDVTERKRAEDAVIRVNECLLSLGSDVSENIRTILALGGELLGASFLLFNHIKEDILITVESWHAPESIPPVIPANGSLCYEVYRQNRTLLVLENLQESPFAETLPYIRKFGLETYAGHVVRYHGEVIGMLCAMFTRPADISESDRNLLGILATAISREEERRIASETLRASEEQFRAQYQNNPLAIFTWQKSGDDFQLIDYNRAALDLSEGRAAMFLGKSARGLYSSRPEVLGELMRCFTEKTVISTDLISQNLLPGRYIHSTISYVPPDMVLVHNEDITERKQAEQSLELARRKLNLLNTVTFQDIQSLVFSTSAYIHLIKTTSDPDKTKEYLEKENELVQQISSCLDFTHHYQDLGMFAPRWQKMKDVIIYAISHLNFTGIEKTIDLDNLEVYADPLLEKATVHIIQNVIEGAGRTTIMNVSSFESDGRISVCIEGANAGIPMEEKETLFQHSFGGSRGLGLFLAREILSITGIAIQETGSPGTCTRFEIFVPGGAFRNRHQ